MKKKINKKTLIWIIWASFLMVCGLGVTIARIVITVQNSNRHYEIPKREVKINFLYKNEIVHSYMHSIDADEYIQFFEVDDENLPEEYKTGEYEYNKSTYALDDTETINITITKKRAPVTMIPYTFEFVNDNDEVILTNTTNLPDYYYYYDVAKLVPEGYKMTTESTRIDINKSQTTYKITVISSN
ncbi:hypothetical protein NPA13_02855 [Mycoplasma sp. 2045]|uniref:hypothetical protein n=1 Tax=Mycoplasma sp. 2045 TaxID=2967301 RepID=UPI00211BFDCC|nr:hypothetical protein [Mycoplasma sp. 2045]UUM20368.1 hypothetical protein NPA13_02855 [Mycoplasma sp. 2045]